MAGKKTGENPTDRAKQGTKRSVLTDGQGIPISVAVAGANTHDMRLVDQTLSSVPISVPDPEQTPQHLYLDKGYDYQTVRQTVAEYGYTAHIPSRGELPRRHRKLPGYRSHRWVVERTHSWMNRFRRLLVRWEKKSANCTAMLQLACACITYSASGVLG